MNVLYVNTIDIRYTLLIKWGIKCRTVFADCCLTPVLILTEGVQDLGAEMELSESPDTMTQCVYYE